MVEHTFYKIEYETWLEQEHNSLFAPISSQATDDIPNNLNSHIEARHPNGICEIEQLVVAAYMIGNIPASNTDDWLGKGYVQMFSGKRKPNAQASPIVR